jgi:hypothetical protein
VILTNVIFFNKQAVKMLQQVMKGHLERSRSLNNTRDKSLSRSRSESPQSIARPSSRLRDDNKSSRGSVRAYDNNSNSQRYDRPTSRNSNHLMRKRTSFDSDGDYDEEDNIKFLKLVKNVFLNLSKILYDVFDTFQLEIATKSTTINLKMMSKVQTNLFS